MNANNFAGQLCTGTGCASYGTAFAASVDATGNFSLDNTGNGYLFGDLTLGSGATGGLTPLLDFCWTGNSCGPNDMRVINDYRGTLDIHEFQRIVPHAHLFWSRKRRFARHP